jgi:hypothetical protein
MDPELTNEEVDITETAQELTHKADLMLLTNGWNDKNEVIVISTGEGSASYKWMHEKSAAFYKSVNQALSILLIMVSTVLSAETIIPSDESNLALSIIRSILIYIVTVVSVIMSFLKYEKLSEQHLVSATAYGQLYHDIQQQMCMYRRDRHNATKYVSDVLKQYDTLTVNGPSISQRVIKQFKNAFKNANISVPGIADRIQKIEVITEPNYLNNQVPVPEAAKQYNGVSNLNEIHQAFQIQGDISDKDIQNANPVELRNMKRVFINNNKTSYEMQRFLGHSSEDD